MKRHTTDWKNVQNLSDKGTMSRKYKELLYLSNININDSIKKWIKDLNRQYHKKDIPMANKHMEIYLTPLVSRKM